MDHRNNSLIYNAPWDELTRVQMKATLRTPVLCSTAHIIMSWLFIHWCSHGSVISGEGGTLKEGKGPPEDQKFGDYLTSTHF